MCKIAVGCFCLNNDTDSGFKWPLFPNNICHLCILVFRGIFLFFVLEMFGRSRGRQFMNFSKNIQVLRNFFVESKQTHKINKTK